MKSIFRQLLRNAIPLECSLDSKCDFHVKGIDYLCLFRDERLTVKLYFIPDGVEFRESGHLVGFHDHAYAFDTIVLQGEVGHRRVSETKVGGWNKYTYRSPLRGGTGFEFLGKCGLKTRESVVVNSFRDSIYHVAVGEIHSIAPTGDVVLGLIQYCDEVEQTAFYTRHDSPPLLDGLYGPMSEQRAAQLIEAAMPLVE